jgi:hypothetical protein
MIFRGRTNKPGRLVLRSLALAALSFQLLVGVSCNSDDVKNAVDAVDEPDRKTIDVSKTGLNAFANDPGFGSICEQFREVKDTLGISSVRILFSWNDGIQASPSSDINFSFYDDIANCLPAGVEAVAVLTSIPSWMRNSANWINGDPRETFVRLWVKKVARRYAGNSRITGFQIWNEPNIETDPDNATLGVLTNPEAYVAMMARAYNEVKEQAPGKLVLNGATTAIGQNFPDTLDYNKRMIAAGLAEFVDVFAIHYYGKSYERVVARDGVAAFLAGVPRAVWVTESGRQGVDQQLEYVERTWPFLMEKIPSIDKIFYYQHTSGDAPENSFALRTRSAAQPFSDLYRHLESR